MKLKEHDKIIMAGKEAYCIMMEECNLGRDTVWQFAEHFENTLGKYIYDPQEREKRFRQKIAIEVQRELDLRGL